jgi:hypothetical protein
MYTHPDNAASLHRDRHRAMRADIGSHRLARQLREMAGAARRARITRTACTAAGARSRVRAPTPESASPRLSPKPFMPRR